MSKLIRGGATRSAHKLMTRILERSELTAAVRELSAPLLGQLIDHVGLEDAGELVALASTEQITRVWDRDLWTRDDLDAPERFDPDRFALWLAVLLEAGEEQLVERLRAQPIGFLTLALHRLVRVVDQVQWSRMLEHEEDELDTDLSAPWHELVLIARDAGAWDAVLAALLALDQHDHAFLRELLERCCDLDFEGSELDSDEVGERSEDAVLERDVAAEREARQAISGYVTASDARAFLQLALEPVPGPAAQLRRDAITNAYFREVGVAETAAPRSDVEPESVFNELVLRPAEDRAGLVELMALLASSGVIAAPSEFVHAELSAGAAPARKDEPPMSVLQSALMQLQREAPPLWDQRMAELAYLANVLLADARAGTLEPREALERASAICNAGLVAQLREAQRDSSQHAVELLRAVSADRLFRVGYARRTPQRDDRSGAAVKT
jgi:hypothetical protein